MPLIQYGFADRVREGDFIDGATTYFNWRDDVAVMSGNHDIEMRSLKGAKFLYTSHHGLCIRDREMNGYDDSDFYMTIWDEEAQAPYEYMFATTRGYTYDLMGSSPDATPEVMAAYEAWFKRQQENELARRALRDRIETVKECLHMVHKGATCRVARGRKVPKGTVGKVLGLTEKPDYMGHGKETWALLDIGTGFVSVLERHLDIIERSPEALQRAFDAAC